MKVELSKREIEVILELMEAGITFLITHQWVQSPIKKDDKEKVNIKNLEDKLKEAITTNKCLRK